jgi:putative tricarboxylic transport membrane protein
VNPTGFQRWQGIVAGGVLLLLGLGICAGTFSVGTLPGQDSLGPRLFPLLIGGGLIIFGLANIWRGWVASRAGVTPVEEAFIPGSEAEWATEPGDWPTLIWVITGLVIGAAGYKFIGFMPSAWIVFLLTARGFAGHWSWRHALVGLIVVLVAFFGFTKGLGLHLPTGILSSVLGGH